MKYKFNDWSKSPKPAQWEKFLNQIYRMIRKEFGVDEDGDSPIEIWAIDRTRFEKPHWWPVPYYHGPKTEEEIQAIEDAITFNLEIAINDFRRFRNVQTLRKRNEKAKKA